MRRVLVTGAAGFIGTNLVRALLGRGDDVHASMRPASDDWRLRDLRGSLPVHQVDITDATTVNQMVASVRPDYVFHTAVHGAYPTQRNFDAMLRTNVAGTLNLLEASAKAGVETFVHTGSSSEYGAKDHAPSEEELPEPNSHYAISKVAAGMTCRFFAATHDMKVRILRLYSVYGPWEEPTRFVPTLIVEGLRGRLPNLASPSIARDFVHVDDVVRAFLLAAESEFEERAPAFNVGTGTQTTLAAAVDAARRIFGITDEPRWNSMPRREWDTTVWVANTARIESQLNWRPALRFDEGLRATTAWMHVPEILAIYTARQAR